MARRRGPRRLVASPDQFWWSVRHAHDREYDERGVAGCVGCREIVTIRRDGSRGRLDVVFRAGDGHLVSDGPLHAGSVLRADGDRLNLLNLNEPGVVRAVLDEALAHGWCPATPGRVQIDGWTLFDAIIGRRARTAIS